MKNEKRGRFAFVVSCATAVLIAGCAVGRPHTVQLIPSVPLFGVTQPLRYETKDKAYAIEVPAGFITDLASMPPAARMWQSEAGISMSPAIIHDYLYWEQACAKDEADAVMYLALVEVGMPRADAIGFYGGVRSWKGKEAWLGNAALHASGESRFFKPAELDRLGKTPLDNRTWAELHNEAAQKGWLILTHKAPVSVKTACVAALTHLELERQSWPWWGKMIPPRD